MFAEVHQITSHLNKKLLPKGSLSCFANLAYFQEDNDGEEIYTEVGRKLFDELMRLDYVELMSSS